MRGRRSRAENGSGALEVAVRWCREHATLNSLGSCGSTRSMVDVNNEVPEAARGWEGRRARSWAEAFLSMEEPGERIAVTSPP